MSIMDCINIKERNRKTNKDNGVYNFFENVLIGYIPFINDEKYQDEEDIIVNDNDQAFFWSLRENYEISKSQSNNEFSSTEDLSHAFAWYLSSGVIVLRNRKFYINKDKLLEKIDEYNEYQKDSKPSFEDGQKDNGIPYTKK